MDYRTIVYNVNPVIMILILTQCWGDVVSPSTTLAQHYPNIDLHPVFSSRAYPPVKSDVISTTPGSTLPLFYRCIVLISDKYAISVKILFMYIRHKIGVLLFLPFLLA